MDYVNYVAGSQTGIPQTVGAAVGTVAGPVATRIIAVDVEEMQDCLIKQKNLGEGLIDLNDPCNKWTALIRGEEYNYEKMVAGIPPSIMGLGMLTEATYKEIPKGILMDNSYYAADTFKNVPILKNAFASTGTPINQTLINVKKTWELTRNIAFMILLVAALVTGITLMTSKALSGKDSDAKIITAEKALPRVILAVILISSSYWIGELTLNALVGSGIVQGIAKFLAGSLLPGEGATSYLDFPLGSLLLFLLGATAIFAAPVVGIFFIAVLIFFVLVYIRLNFYIFRNVVFTMLYIIVAPFILAQGALPGDMSGNAFKKYAYQLVYFIASGFIFALILYSTSAIIAAALPLPRELQSGTPGTEGIGQAITGIAGNFFPGIFNIFFTPIIAIIILDQATKVHGLAASFASKVTGVNEGLGFLSAGGASSGGSAKS